MEPSTIVAIQKHAAREYPRESCGVIIANRFGKEQYVECRNLAPGKDHFIMDGRDYAAAEMAGDIIAIVHSHPNVSATPSQADLVECERSKLPWVIVNWPTGQIHEFKPTGYKAPLVGRQFVHGILDCYTLVRDYFREELGIDIPDFERSDGWWHKGENLYVRNYQKAGFFQVRQEDLKKHDVIIMQVASPKDPNHAAIYIGNNMILHHVMRRISCRTTYGGYWRKHTALIVRHRALT